MKSIKFAFLVIVAGIFFISLFLFNKFQSPMNPEIKEISEFQVTEISGNGSVYMAKEPIDKRNYSFLDHVEVKKMDYSDDVYLKADSNTSYEFYCSGSTFTALPGTYLFYQPQKKRLSFFEGELFWEKEIKKGQLEIALIEQYPYEEGVDSGIVRLILSDSGKVKTVGKSVVEVSSYQGDLTLTHKNQDYFVNSNQVLTLRDGRVGNPINILSSPQFIYPEEGIIVLNKPGDSIVRFKWGAVEGAKRYIFKLFTSNLKENILFETIAYSNQKNYDLLNIDETSECFWQVIPYDFENRIEGSPSKIGHIKIKGVLLNKENILKPPRLVISSITVSGNMVIIKGEADLNSQLFINEEVRKIDMDGTFLHTMTFQTIGNKTIVLRLVSPSEVETKIEKQVMIFDE
jgi:hypothetical protein